MLSAEIFIQYARHLSVTSFSGYIPTVAVGVVGIGHVPGMVVNWEHQQHNIKDIMK